MLSCVSLPTLSTTHILSSPPPPHLLTSSPTHTHCFFTFYFSQFLLAYFNYVGQKALLITSGTEQILHSNLCYKQAAWSYIFSEKRNLLGFGSQQHWIYKQVNMTEFLALVHKEFLFFYSQELQLPFMKLAATELVSGVSGESEQKMRNLFEKARVSFPSSTNEKHSF